MRRSLVFLVASALHVSAAFSVTPESDVIGFIQKRIAEGDRLIRVPKARYRLTPKGEVYLPLKGLRDVEIDFGGSEFVGTVKTQMIGMQGCTNVTLRNLVIDYDALPFTQGVIVKVDADRNWDVKVIPGYPLPEGPEVGLDTVAKVWPVQVYDRDSLELKNPMRFQRETKIEKTGADTYRVSGGIDRRGDVGDICVWSVREHHRPFRRQTVTSSHCASCLFENVVCYSTPYGSCAFSELFAASNVYRRCAVRRRAPEDDPVKRGLKRLRSGNHDAFNSRRSFVGPTLEGCTFRHHCDDCVNISGYYGIVSECAGRTLRVLSNGPLAESGDTAQVMTYDGRCPPDVTVVSIRPVGRIRPDEGTFLADYGFCNGIEKSVTTAHEVIVDRELGLPFGSVIASNRMLGNGFVIRDCDFGSCRARGLLIKASDGLIESNVVSGCFGPAVVSTPEYQWLEAGCSSRLTIRGNTFRDNRDAGVWIGGSAGNRQPLPKEAHRDIRIVGNRISGSSKGIRLEGCQDYEIEENEISIQADLLVVGDNEAACAAAVQAVRSGVSNVVLVSDCAMLGGQYSAQGVGPVDERVEVDGESLDFPRSGMALEIIRAMGNYNLSRYGRAWPGNCWSATRTIEPRPAAEIFERLVREAGAALRVFRVYRPVETLKDGERVVGVKFDRGLEVRAALTIDASDWGDVIRLGGVKHYLGVDPKSRFGEANAPEVVGAVERQEMNSITWTMTLVEKPDAKPIAKPEGYDAANYWASDVWRDDGIYATAYPKDVKAVPYTQRRLVDSRHFRLKDVAGDKIQLNATVMDYPLCQWPKEIAEKLEKVQKGASELNFAELPHEAKQVVYEDAKRRSLGYLYFLQNDNPKTVERMRKFELSDEFGTVDRLPPKPYVREGLRLAAVKTLTANEVAAKEGEKPVWAACPADAAFGFQFHLDFHPTRRQFIGTEGTSSAWVPRHAGVRNWSAASNRAFFPYSAFIPETTEGLLGAGKNVGVSSLVQSALRLHPQMVLSGQCAGALAAMALAQGKSPREVVSDKRLIRLLQEMTVRPADGHPGVAIWAWHGLEPDDPAFYDANIPVVRPYPENPSEFTWSSNVDSWSRDRAERLLTRWCDALVAYQVKTPDDPRVRGSLLCPGCALQHGRICDMAYPMVYLWTRTGEAKYLDSAKEAVAWSRHNLTDLDGARLRNDFQNAWWGISVFSQIAIGKTLLHFGEKLPDGVRADWRNWFGQQTAFVAKALDIDGDFNINYSAALCEALALAWKVSGDRSYLEKARRRAGKLVKYMLPDGMLAGEKHPPDFVSPHGYRPVDLGYNAEESIPSLYHYAELTGDAAFADRLDALGRGVLEFMLSDGGIDNSMGSRLCKWTYYGSRTSDGALPMLAAMAERKILSAVRAIDRHLGLLERCTSQASGLLTGGLFYDEADEGACVHHAFTHAKSLVDLLLSKAPIAAVAAALPRERPYGIRTFPSFGTTLAAVGPWRASFSFSDVHHNPEGTMNGGGSLTLLYHERLGLVCAGTMARYATLEHENMQVQRRDSVTRCLTPRIEWADAFSSEDASATSCATGTPAHVVSVAKGARFEQRFELKADRVTICATAKGRWRYVLPIVAKVSDEVSVAGCEVTLRRKEGAVRVRSSHPLRLERTARGDRAFTPIAGLMAAYFVTDELQDGQSFSVALSADE